MMKGGGVQSSKTGGRESTKVKTIPLYCAFGGVIATKVADFAIFCCCCLIGQFFGF